MYEEKEFETQSTNWRIFWWMDNSCGTYWTGPRNQFQPALIVTTYLRKLQLNAANLSSCVSLALMYNRKIMKLLARLEALAVMLLRVWPCVTEWMVPTFRRNLVPSSSRVESSKKKTARSFRNVGSHTPIDTESHLRRLESWGSLLCNVVNCFISFRFKSIWGGAHLTKC